MKEFHQCADKKIVEDAIATIRKFKNGEIIEKQYIYELYLKLRESLVNSAAKYSDELRLKMEEIYSIENLQKQEKELLIFATNFNKREDFNFIPDIEANSLLNELFGIYYSYKEWFSKVHKLSKKYY